VAAQTAYLVHLFTGIPFSVTAHAKDVYRDAVDPIVFREIADAAVALVTVCESNRRYLGERLLAGRSPRVERIYNGVDLDRLSPPDTARDPRLILGVGRLIEKKGYHVLLHACRLLADRGVAYRCVLVGDGDQRARLLADRDRLDLGGRVDLAGTATRDYVLAWMRRARVLAAPCLTAADGNRDALPTVLLEALALGLPAVSTPVGGIPEIVEDGVEGLLVPEGDPVALAAALQRLLEDGSLWSRTSAAGPPKAAARFDRRAAVRSLIDVFRRGPRPALRSVQGVR
jgi:colanic acid/amylovoran biosynthesis glycosyltransferase